MDCSGLGVVLRLKKLLLGAACLLVPAQAHAEWHESKSRHFVIYGDASPEWMRAYSIKLEKFDQAVRTLRNMDDPAPGESGRVTIFILPDTKAVSKMAVGRRSSIAGFYMPRASGSVAFVPQRIDRDLGQFVADNSLFHEYAHHLMYQSVEQALPPWLIEGFAEFYTTAKFEGKDTVRLAMPAEHRASGLYYLPRPNLETFFGTRPYERKSNSYDAEAFYGWAWLLTHYLNFAEERKGQLGRYVAAVYAGEDSVAAAKRIFGDLKQLGNDADRYLRREKFLTLAVKQPPPSESGVAVRPLTKGESAMMPHILTSKRGVDSETAPKVAADARRTAAQFPDDPAVLIALAEAEYDADNYSAAEAAAARATQLNPRLGEAWIYLGRAQMRAEGPRNWDRIRDHFLKANALDKEDAEPLWLFYQSFGAAGQAPTQNAKDALDYALVLGPQDPNLRIQAAMQRLHDKRFKEAREALVPVAFSPHPSGARDAAKQAVEAIDSKRADAALAALGTGDEEPSESGDDDS